VGETDRIKSRKNNYSEKMSSEQLRQQQKEALLQALKRSPIVELACQKIGISRMTFYRWIKNDKIFAKNVNEKILFSRAKVNDLAESKLIENISNNHFSSISFWLRYNSGIYKQQKDILNESEETNISFISHSLFRFHNITPKEFIAPAVFLDCLSCSFAIDQWTCHQTVNSSQPLFLRP